MDISLRPEEVRRRVSNSLPAPTRETAIGVPRETVRMGTGLEMSKSLRNIFLPQCVRTKPTAISRLLNHW
jgi:hypothetical protein